MATRSNIGYETENGNIRFVYCHWDGYLDGLGEDLHNDYQDRELVINLIEAGDMSYLKEPYTSKGEDFDKLKPREVTKPQEVHQEEYCYIFTKENSWVVCGGEQENFVELSEVL